MRPGPAELALLVVSVLVVSGCKKDDMADDPKLRTYEPTAMLVDGTEARPLVAGTVPRSPRNTPGIPYAMQWEPGPVGAVNTLTSDTIPVPVTRELIDLGKERYSIYCAVCHGRLGDGNGMIVQRGFIRPPSYHTPRLTDPASPDSRDSHIYDVITNGRGAMFSYSERVAPRDRWAIVAYIRTLQASVKQAAKDGKITAEQYKALQGEVR